MPQKNGGSFSELIFTNNPNIALVFDDTFSLIDCNPASVAFFGFQTKEEMIADFFSGIDERGAPFHSADKVSQVIKKRLQAVSEKGQERFEAGLTIDKKPKMISVLLKRLDLEGTFVILAYIVDLTEIKEEQNELIHQDNLLQSVNEVAEQLITSTPTEFEYVLWECLRVIGRTVDADRVYIWENYEEDGQLFSRQTHEWSEGAEPQQGKDFTVSLPYDEVPYWRDCVMTGQVINGPVRELPDEERAVLEPQGILSILVIPVMLGEEPWGFIGFDDCVNYRQFAEVEEQVLQSAGILMVSAILRNRMTQNLIDVGNELEGQERLLRAANEVAGMMIADVGENFSEVMLDALRILSQSVDSDRAFIWRNSMVDGVLCSSELCEWAKDVHSLEGAPMPKDVPYETFIPEWRTTLLKGKNMNMLVREMSREFREFPGARGVLTTLNIPLTIRGEFWGMIGFDNMHMERLYTETEQDILKSGGMLIASAIIRDETLQNLTKAKEEAQESTKAKTEFLSRMSHEIRTPMNAIIGMNTLAQKSDDLPKIKYYLGRIADSSRQLLSIINDVLDMSKIESGKFEISEHEFDFEKMLQHVFNVIQVKLDEKRQELELKYEGPFDRAMISDELRLSQVLLNLLTNAVKFTPDFGKITVKIREEKLSRERSTLHIEVTDNGIGISSEQQKRLFTSFEQADGSITRQFGGSGLGLAICKKIVELMGGDIWVNSSLGKGSTFAFEIPISWGRQYKTGAQSLPEDLKILLVDDSLDALDYLESLFGSFSLMPDTASSGAEAIEKAEAAVRSGTPYNLVFLDWYMPGKSGRETAGEIVKILPEEAKVVITSVADWSEIEGEMKEIGVRHFLPKPVLPSTLYDTLVQLSGQVPENGGQSEEQKFDWQDKKILLVEDIEINREILMALLEETGVEIDCAENGLVGTQMFSASSGNYDLILMDVQMPIMDGLEATRKIRAMDKLPDSKTIPILAMTANAFKEDIEACMSAGMNGHISKPIEVDSLLQVMSEYLK